MKAEKYGIHSSLDFGDVHDIVLQKKNLVCPFQRAFLNRITIGFNFPNMCAHTRNSSPFFLLLSVYLHRHRHTASTWTIKNKQIRGEEGELWPLLKHLMLMLLVLLFCVHELDVCFVHIIFPVNVIVWICFCEKLLSVMDVFLYCLIRGLHGALMKVPQPVAISLHEDGFAV